eukprot:CAMPEP_0203786086 /NCGR_PEP_ID=MMETSP0100_2-20121128/1409_1 /ASSEMBLY_ACC=CAM_ASM_000210 /TAXON_ID=96639 /ORGANISM=" , Strain NY0313808BC1" /LENGTH=641 /DNA_ID=CAMNT_0050688305 /DNA_START=157 /DNA_END=2082 /DNA_ORIENTATION=-
MRREEFHGLMPRNNPILGSFQHAPSAQNASSKFFSADIMSHSEYLRRKELRHNPFTGQFHPAPKQFTDLHGLSRFRNSKFRTDSTRSSFDDNYLPSGSSDLSGASTVNSASTEESSVLSRASWSEADTDPANALPDPILVFSADVEGFGAGYDSRIPSKPPGPHRRAVSLNLKASGQEEDGAVCDSPSSALDRIKRTTTAHHPVESWSDWEDEEGTYGFNYDSEDTDLVRPQLTKPKASVSPISKPRSVRGDSLSPTLDGPRWSVSSLPTQSKLNSMAHSNVKSFDGPVTSSPLMLGSWKRDWDGAYASDEGSVDSPDLDDEDGEHQANRWFINRTTDITKKYHLELSNKGTLGRGAYSVVKHAKSIAPSKHHGFAVKIIRKRMLVSKEEKEMIKREVEIHQVLVHRNIVRLFEVFEDSKRLFLVLERASSKTLSHLLVSCGGKLPELACQHLMKQCTRAIAYLHENGVLQGDLKPENILLVSTTADDSAESQVDLGNVYSLRLKLCDFGLSRKVPDIKYYKYTGDVHKVPYTSLRGTIGYVAPEILRKEAYTIAVDIWSAGIILYEMLSGTKPFVPYHDCVHQPVAFPGAVFGDVSEDAKTFVRKMLTVDVAERMTAKAALGDSWLAHVLTRNFSSSSGA